MRGIVSDRNAIDCDASTYATGFRESGEPAVLPAITPAEHFSVIVHPVASGLPYIAYLLESMEAFHGNRAIGIRGICTDSQSDGMRIDYCIRIVEELKRNENAMEVVSSGWIYGQKQYAMDIVLTHPNTEFSDLLPRRSC
ncbi:uncharacterized protein C2845_PM04G04460 [Panicum miliaceum]|uniref:Uncharacterized protein n=1 Tax=Panicum miliaceum TaxID=4540 RepID=A0A3L6QSJ1_PANMI|nr:uncharacterized protein C2845_PM04G04460 [Panicum miliaceum]